MIIDYKHELIHNNSHQPKRKKKVKTKQNKSSRIKKQKNKLKYILLIMSQCKNAANEKKYKDKIYIIQHIYMSSNNSSN